jgi:hypothetical protein
MCKKKHAGRCQATCGKCHRWGHHHSACENERVTTHINLPSSFGDRDLAFRTTAGMPQGTLVTWGDWRPGEEGPNTRRNRRKRATKVFRRRQARKSQRENVDSQLDEESEQEQEDMPDFSGPYLTLAMRPGGTQTPQTKDGKEDQTSKPESSKEKQ